MSQDSCTAIGTTGPLLIAEQLRSISQLNLLVFLQRRNLLAGVMLWSNILLGWIQEKIEKNSQVKQYERTVLLEQIPRSIAACLREMRPHLLVLGEIRPDFMEAQVRTSPR